MTLDIESPRSSGAKEPAVSAAEILLDPETPCNNIKNLAATPSNGVKRSAASRRNSAASSVEDRYCTEREEAKVTHWKKSIYAVGLVQPTWADESKNEGERPCGLVSLLASILCARIGAKRVGNMAVLRESLVVDNTVEKANSSADNNGSNDEIPAGQKRTNSTSPRIDIVVGPFWPMCVCVTLPIIIGVSICSAFALPGQHPAIIVLWSCGIVGLLLALFQTSCRDPGIMLRKREDPTRVGDSSGSWRWNDQALTFRNREAMYDSDCACVIEKFDHTCPWTGTAIGKDNMFPFNCFLCLLFLNLLIDCYLIANAYFQ